MIKPELGQCSWYRD